MSEIQVAFEHAPRLEKWPKGAKSVQICLADTTIAPIFFYKKSKNSPPKGWREIPREDMTIFEAGWCACERAGWPETTPSLSFTNITAHILCYSFVCSKCENNPDYEPQIMDYPPVDEFSCDSCGKVYTVGVIEMEPPQ